jgi:hypothetical protein
MGDGNLEDRIKCEVEFARALTALLLAARLDQAELRAQEALDRVLNRRRAGRAFRSGGPDSFTLDSLHPTR